MEKYLKKIYILDKIKTIINKLKQTPTVICTRELKLQNNKEKTKPNNIYFSKTVTNINFRMIKINEF